MFSKNNILRNSIFLVAFFLLAGADCSRPGSEPTCYISEEFKSYVIFNQGSNWIYIDQNQNKDTVEIVNLEKSIEDGPYTYPHEKYIITVWSSIRGEEKSFSQCVSNSRIGCDGFSILSGRHDLSFFCCCEEGTQEGTLTSLRLLDSLVISNSMYYNIRVFESDSLSLQVNKKLYYAKNIGLIKYEDFDDNIWELVKYDVFQ